MGEGKFSIKQLREVNTYLRQQAGKGFKGMEDAKGDAIRLTQRQMRNHARYLAGKAKTPEEVKETFDKILNS